MKGGKGVAENIIFQNIFMKEVKNPIIIDQFYCDKPSECPQKVYFIFHDFYNGKVCIYIYIYIADWCFFTEGSSKNKKRGVQEYKRSECE